jgi:hypothetical protein
VEACLNDDVLFSVYRPAYLLSLPGGDVKLVPEASQFKAIGKTGGSPVVAGGKYMLVPNGQRSNVMASAGSALSDHGSDFKEIVIGF